jgi:hypothetical protein
VPFIEDEDVLELLAWCAAALAQEQNDFQPEEVTFTPKVGPQ